ncbi:MAG: radical SAM protein [Firmicutes bacterium]|jgi:pyruvate-formate lyase-activating enzyme|nr:radical SAM protein [Bacillota bacterium]
MNRSSPNVHELLYASHSAGVLPITSECNLGCVFCSNRFNPPGVEAVSLPARGVDELRDSLDQLAGATRIVLGESATRICEGEPLTHPAFERILCMVRDRYPDIPLRVTTNGTLLTEALARRLSSLGDIEVTVSLNSTSAAVRRALMRDDDPARVLDGIRRLHDWGVRFHGSVVVLPHGPGAEDALETVRFLGSHGARTCRLLVPGYTRCVSSPEFSVPRTAVERLARCASEWTTMPVTVEPPIPRDLSATIDGVIAGSPAQRAGLRRGDRILAVDGARPESKVHAFEAIYCGGEPVIEVERRAGGRAQRFGVKLDKRPREAPGIVMEHDVDVSRVREAVMSAARMWSAPVFISSGLGIRAVRVAMASLGGMGGEWSTSRLFQARNSFFGGNIGCAGLLTVSDVSQVLEGLKRRGIVFDAVVIPGEFLDRRGRDITGRPYTDIESSHGVSAHIA